MPQGLVRGYYFWYGPMPSIVEPAVKRAVVFFEGQNLFYAASPTYTNTRGIDKTDWIRISRQVYDACIDRRDYRTNV